jgi:membrane protein
MSVVGFLKLDTVKLTEQIVSFLPYSLTEPAKVFINEITNVKSANILSFSLIISIYGASSGFRTAMRGINKAYGRKDTRSQYIKIPVSIILVIIFAVIIIISFAFLIFGGNIIAFAKNNFFDMPKNISVMFNILRYTVSIAIMFFLVILINKLALYKNKKVSVKSLIPGTVFTVSLWLIISRLFNIYIENVFDPQYGPNDACFFKPIQQVNAK